MSTAKKLALIAAGYVLAIAGAGVASAIHEFMMPADVAQGSPGMVAFGDVVLFIFVAGLLGLVPTFFLLRLCQAKAPRGLLKVLLVLAALGPLAWLTTTAMAVTATPDSHILQGMPQAVLMLIGPLIAFAAIPRMVLGPALVVVEGITFLLTRERATRMLLVAAMLMDIVPIGLFTLHMMRAMMRYH